MFSTMPEAAKEWASKTDFSKLPEKARKKKKKVKTDKEDVQDKIAELLDMSIKFANTASKI